MLRPGRACGRLTEISRYVYEMANMNFRNNQPFVGPSAFAHKGGMHVHGIRKNAVSYEHIDPEPVGNERRILVSELSGKSTIAEKLERVSGSSRTRSCCAKVLDAGAGPGERGLPVRGGRGVVSSCWSSGSRAAYKPAFERLGYRSVSVADPAETTPVTEATVKLRVGECVEHDVGEGDGPVNALDAALRKALEPHFPGLAEMHLVDYKVRVINARDGHGRPGPRGDRKPGSTSDVWGTVGVMREHDRGQLAGPGRRYRVQVGS